MNNARVIAEILKAEGVEFVTCFPHSEIIDAAAAVGIRPILARTERGALHIADGYTRMHDGRKIGTATVQYGPGSENAFGGVAQAYGENVPILYLPTGYRQDQQGVAPNFDARANLQHITKWGGQVVLGERIPAMMQHAFAQLRNGRPGPVMIEIPIDILAANARENGGSYIPQRRSVSLADPRDVGEVVEALLRAKRPMIIAGQGIFYAQAWEELRTFAELLGLPVMTTLNGKSAFSEDHPLSLGAGGASRRTAVDRFLDQADVILCVATSLTRSDYITPIPQRKTLIQITNTERDVSKDYSVSMALIGDAKEVLKQLLGEIRSRGEAGRDANQFVSEIATLHRAFLSEWRPILESDEEPITPYRIISALMSTVDRTRTVVTHDAGSPRDQMIPFYEAVVPHGYMSWGKTTQLGLGIPLMMGAKLAKPDWLCVNVMGDGAFGMIGMDFETAVREKLPILTIVMNNGLMGGYGGDSGYLPVASRKFNLHRLSGDYVKIGEGLGGYVERVTRVADLVPAIRRAIQQTEDGRAVLLEVITREEKRFAKGNYRQNRT